MARVRNPILPGCYPDPSVCRVGDSFYLVTSTFEYFPGLPVFHSTDLVSWQQVGHVIDRPGQLDYQGLRYSHGLFAPTIRHHDGVFWVVCTLVGTPDGEPGGNFVVTATDPAGPWSDPVWLDEDGIDPSIFFDDDGRVWLHGTRPAREPTWPGQTEVWVRELDPVSRKLTGTEHVIWHGAVLGAVWAEGPHLYKVDGAYYLLAAEGGTEFHHATSVARAESVTGPYVGNRSNPVLTHRHLGRGMEIVGVGHADLVQAVDGSWWAVLLGMRPYGGYHYNLGRETFLVPVVWEDGWPVFAPGVGRIPDEVEVPFAGEPRPGEAQGSTSGVVPPGSLRWTSLRGPATEFATPDGQGWTLAVRPATLTEPITPAFLGIRQQHQDVDARAVVVAPLAPGEEAGLVVRQNERDHVTLAITAGDDGTRRVRAMHRRADVETVIGELPTPAPDGPVTLVVSTRGQEYALLAAPDGGEPGLVAVADGTTLDSTATGGFTGVWLGVYATSNGRPTSTRVRVEHLSYEPRALSPPR
ncbi:glycoside hydrolase family 43 protein [Plantactinospora sp. WMMB334]|uniref:glycoside hydrolase family 43 protein n=1 Tax=Plantactinospora sp. WMMB334 TaxID=3404119 RepID=UPI003B92426F